MNIWITSYLHNKRKVTHFSNHLQSLKSFDYAIPESVGYHGKYLLASDILITIFSFILVINWSRRRLIISLHKFIKQSVKEIIYCYRINREELIPLKLYSGSWIFDFLFTKPGIEGDFLPHSTLIIWLICLTGTPTLGTLDGDCLGDLITNYSTYLQLNCAGRNCDINCIIYFRK